MSTIEILLVCLHQANIGPLHVAYFSVLAALSVIVKLCCFFFNYLKVLLCLCVISNFIVML